MASEQRERAEIDGLLLVDKPGHSGTGPDAPASAAPPTSHDIVQRVRRLSRQRRIGHTGTLDPMASGLLVLCLGKATRLVEYYQGHDKRYQAEVTLGYATDTYDALGVVTERAPLPTLDVERAEAALAGFRGAITQRPPVYSALKQGGESVHYKARRGEEVIVEERPVTFHAITLLGIEPPDRLLLDVRCSAGAYLRSLAYDLGRALGSAATLTALRRTAAGAFAIEQAHTLTAIEEAAGRLADLLLPPGVGLDLPALSGDAELTRRLGHGQIVPLPDSTVAAGLSGTARYLDASGALLGIIRLAQHPESEGAPACWRAEKWFA